MTDDAALDALRRIGWRGDAPAGRVVRVVVQHRAGYEVSDGASVFAAQPVAAFLRRRTDPAARPAVGDFVTLDAAGEISAVLPRHSTLKRAAAGERYAQQIIATNVDTVLVLTGLDGDFNPRRIERYLSLVEPCGADAVVVLTKADTVTDAEARRTALASRLPATAPVLAVDARSADGIAGLAPWLAPGATVVLVGSSGAGKSTLTNTLLGTGRMATREVRRHDSRGRHTTTCRALLPLPCGACLIDTPGMRELKLTGTEDLELFADIDALVARCRFADCRHDTEPGCAVQAALAAGELDAQRWAHFQKLATERAHQAALRGGRGRRGGRPVPPRGDAER